MEFSDNARSERPGITIRLNWPLLAALFGCLWFWGAVVFGLFAAV
jgi:hypothetical protein